MTIKKLKRLLGLIGIPLCLACSHGVTVAEFPPTADPAAELQKLDADMTSAVAERQEDVLSPKNFANASEALNDAKDARSKGKDGKTVLEKVARGRAYLNEADRVTKVSNQSLGDIATIRQEAITAGAKDNQKEEMAKADEALVTLTTDIENNNSIKDKDKQEVQQKFLAIEFTAIDRARLAKAKNLVDQAKQAGAEKLSPRTLAIATEKINVAETAIKTDRHNNSLLDRVCGDATTAAQHALDITNESKQTRVESPEEIALAMEAKRNALTQKTSEVQAVTAENQKTSAELSKVEGDNASLEKNKRFNDTLAKAQGEFKPNEAEVFRQGDNLLIRLKGLQFKSGSSELASRSLPLLSKAKDVIESVGPQSIVVEGHTDSVGSRSLNEKISKGRAEVVANYLVTENVIDKNNIESEGYGFDKPIASNKSEKGRAQNRRVDILVTPTK